MSLTLEVLSKYVVRPALIAGEREYIDRFRIEIPSTSSLFSISSHVGNICSNCKYTEWLKYTHTCNGVNWVVLVKPFFILYVFE
jgi:hypothetical protein